MADLKNRILKSFLSFKCLRKVESVTELLFEDKAHTEPNTPSQRQEKKYPGDTANIHCAADTHTYHTLIHYQRGKNTERLTCTNNTHTHSPLQ